MLLMTCIHPICLYGIKHQIFGEQRDLPRPVDVFALRAPLARTGGVDGHRQVGGQRLTPLTERGARPTHGARAESGTAGVGVTVGVRPTL